MRFKSIFWLFNIVVLTALLIFGAATFFLFGKDYAAVYWGNMWIIALLFLLFVGILDFFFVRNWTLFDLLEKEDWPALLAWLEDKLYAGGRLRRLYANLLINTALSVGNYDAVRRLDAEVRQRKPELLRYLGVSLGIPLLNAGNAEAVKAHYDPLADDEHTRNRNWARFCRSLAVSADGRSEMLELLNDKDPSIRLLAWSSLDQDFADLNEAARSALDEARGAIRSDLSGTSGDRALQRSREDHLLAHVFSKQVDETRERIVNAR